MEQQKQKEIMEFFFSSKQKIFRKENGADYDLFVLTPYGWREFSEQARKGVFPDEYHPYTNKKAFFATNNPQIYRRDRVTDKYMYFNGIETTEVTTEQLKDIERAFVAQHEEIEK